MNFLELLIYGFIQGVTEFLPVSSSGHLALLPRFLSTTDPGVAFDLMMHAGTGLSVIVYYRKLIFRLTKNLWPTFKGEINEDAAFLKNFTMATFATFVVVMAIKGYAAEVGRDPFLISVNLVVFGVLMYIIDKNSSAGDNMMEARYLPKKSIMMGVAQAIAVFPGVSRSGITLTMGRGLGLSRTDATHFSFLLSLPLIFGGMVFMLPDFFASTEHISLFDCLLGVVLSFVFGLLTIHFFLKVVKKSGLLIFSLYRILLAVIVFFW